jgi:uncharacterized coiled-coil protein SlyX
MEGKNDKGEVIPSASENTATECAVQDEIVRRINEELADFRQQLKKSQELFHALVSS